MVDEVKRRQEELYREAEHVRLVDEIQRLINHSQGKNKLLASIGRELSGLGSRLEERYGIQASSQNGMRQQSKPEGCS